MSGKDTLRAHVDQAFARGCTLSMPDAVYGPDTGWNRGFLDQQMSYYAFLAGHVASTEASRVVEVGTHFGGSTLALLAGMRAGGTTTGRIVTMDVTDLQRERLEQEPEIVKVVGDSTDSGFMESVAGHLDSPDVDLLYIDALKDAMFVVETLHNTWRAGLRPRWLILDDIQANDSMRSLWTVLERFAPDAAFLISEERPDIRDPRYGFAIVDLLSSGLDSRDEDLMTAVGLDPRQVDLTTPGQRFAEVATVRPQRYDEVQPSAPTADAGIGTLSLVHELAGRHIHPQGDIVEIGCGSGSYTRALVSGLQGNEAVSEPRGRVHAYEAPRDDMETLYTTISPCADIVNVYSLPLNVARWCGRPISMLVSGVIRTPQVQAHLFEEFVPWMMVGSSLIVSRDVLGPWRLFQAYQWAYLADHFRVLRVSNVAAVFGYVKPLSAETLRRVVENRFTPDERVDLVHGYSRTLGGDAQSGFLAQAIRLAREHGDETKAESLLAELDALPPPTTAAARNRLEKLHIQTVTGGVR